MTTPEQPPGPPGPDPNQQAGQTPPYEQPSPAGPPAQYGQPAYGQPPATYGAPGYGYPPSAAYASWLQRVGAYLIDALITGIPSGILIGIGFAIGGGFGLFIVLVGYAAGIAIWVWNTVMRQGNTGQSIGKEQLGITLIAEATGQPVGPGMSFLRQLAHVVDSIPCDIGYLWPLWDNKRQTFADKICSTVVVQR